MRRRPPLQVVALLLAPAGCVDHVPDFGLDVVAPLVVASEPAGGSTGADRDGVIRVTFSEPVTADSVTSESFRVLRNGTPIAGTIATSSTSATFTPSARLDDLTVYFIDVSTGVEDLVGRNLDEPFSAAFSTEDLEWEAPILLSGTGSSYGEVAIDANGDVIAVWNDASGVAAQRIVGGSLQAPMIIVADGFTNNAQVGVSDDGEALATWSMGSPQSLYWSRLLPGSTEWSAPELVETDDTGFVGAARLSVNGSGFAIAAWNQTDSLTVPFRFDIRARPYVPGSEWGLLSGLEARTELAEPPEIAVSENANGIATWFQNTPVGDVWAAHFDVFDGWDATVVLTTGGGTAAVDMDANGDGIVVWGGYSRYVEGSGWEPAVLPDPPLGGVALSPDGGGHVTWMDPPGKLWVAPLSAAGLIGAPMVVASNAGGVSRGTVADGDGRGVVLWNYEVNGRGSLAAARRVDPESWSAPVLLENDDAGDVTSVPSIDVGPNGDVAVLYLRFDGVASRSWVVILR